MLHPIQSSNRSYKAQTSRGQNPNSNTNMGNSSRSSSVSSRGGIDADDAAATTDSMAAFWLQATADGAPSNSNSSQSQSSRHAYQQSYPYPAPSSPPQQRQHLPTVSEVFDQSTIRAPGSSRQATGTNANGLSSVFAPPPVSRSASYNTQDKEDNSKTLMPLDMSIWIPPQSQAQSSNTNVKSPSTATATSSFSNFSLKSSSSQSSQSSISSQEGFYSVSERARSDRHRIISAEYKTRAEVVAAFQRKVEDLMKDFVIALERVDSLNGVGKFSYQD